MHNKESEKVSVCGRDIIYGVSGYMFRVRHSEITQTSGLPWSDLRRHYFTMFPDIVAAETLAGRNLRSAGFIASPG